MTVELREGSDDGKLLALLAAGELDLAFGGPPQDASFGWVIGGAMILVGALLTLQVFQVRGRRNTLLGALVLSRLCLFVALAT